MKKKVVGNCMKHLEMKFPWRWAAQTPNLGPSEGLNILKILKKMKVVTNCTKHPETKFPSRWAAPNPKFGALRRDGQPDPKFGAF
jgi:hypothetical protein